MKTTHLFFGAAALLAACSAPARAEVNEVRFAQQFSMGYLQFNVLKHEHLLEKHAAALGIPDLKVTFATFNGPDMMNDALLAHAVDVVSGGVPGLVTLWARTFGTPQEVRGITGLGGSPILLNTRNPNVHALKDFTAGDRIAVPAVKVAIQAMLIEMGAAQIWGDDQYAKLDPITISLSPPDSTTGLLSGSANFNSAATVPPFQELQLKDPAIHTVLDLTTLIGERPTTTTCWTAKQFHDANPTVYRALVDALREASDIVAADKRKAVEHYVQDSRSKMQTDEIYGFVKGDAYFYSAIPKDTLKYADFMHRVGKTKIAPKSWKDLYFPEIHDLPGS